MEKKNLEQVRREQKKEKRISRVARQIQKELGLMMSEDARRMPGVIVSVSEVRMSPDMSMADVWMSVFPSDRAEGMLQGAVGNVKAIRCDLARRLGGRMRIMPELRFHLDTSLDYAGNIDRLLHGDQDRKTR